MIIFDTDKKTATMNSSLSQFGLLLLRVGFSVMIITHGIPKLQKIIAGDFTFGNPLGIGEAPSLILACISEVVFPLLIIIGFKTRLAAIPVIITMAVAAVIVHANDPFGVKEMSILYLIAFTAIALLGPGKYSVDKK